MSFPRYPAYKDSGVDWLGPIPTSWNVCSLKRIASLQSGESITSEQIETDGAYPVYGGNGLRGYCEDFTHDGEFALIGRQGALCGNINYARGKFWASEHAVVVTPKHAVPTKWIGELLRAMNLNQYSVSAAQPGLSVEIVGNLGIPVPSSDEQSAIATFLDRETAKIDALVAEQEQLITLLKEKRQAVISHAVTKGLDPSVPMKDSGVEWLGAVPAHWQVKQLRHVARIVRGASPRPAGDPKFFSDDDSDENNVPWVTVAEITKDEALYLKDVTEYLTALGAAASQRFERGTVIFSNSGATLGVPKILAIDCCANDGVVAFRYLDPQVNREFLYFFLSTTTERLRTEMKQGGGQPNLNTDIVKNIGFAVPTLDEQQAIVMAVLEQTERFNRLISEAQRGVGFLQERRSALISAAVTGQIDVRGLAAEKEAA